MTEKPKFAIICHNVLSAMGLKSLLGDIVNFADIITFSNVNDFRQSTDHFFHYFVSQKVLSDNLVFFMENTKHVIVFNDTDSLESVPSVFHQINANVSKQVFLKNLIMLMQHNHSNYEKIPENIAHAIRKHDQDTRIKLTKREKEILREIALSKSSKEIADNLNISLSTVLSHRKNIMEKFKAHSSTKLIIYAVMHGLVRADEI